MNSMEMCKTCHLPYKLYKPYMGEMCGFGGDHSDLNKGLRSKFAADDVRSDTPSEQSTEVQASPSPSQEQSLREQIDDIWKDISLDWYGSLEPETEKMAKYLENYTDQILNIIQESNRQARLSERKLVVKEMAKDFDTFCQAKRFTEHQIDGYEMALTDIQFNAQQALKDHQGGDDE